MSEPGRAVIGVSPFSTFFCSADGHPPGRLAEVAAHHLHDRFGEGDVFQRVGGVARVSPEATIISARSPTTFDDGVTLTMSPNRRLTSA